MIAGTAEEIVRRLVAKGASPRHTSFTMSTDHRMDQVPYDSEVLKLVLDEIVTEAAVRALFHASVLADVPTF